MFRLILITGSSGTIGSRLGEILIDSGYEIVGVDKVSNKWSNKVDRVTIAGNLCDESVFR